MIFRIYRGSLFHIFFIIKKSLLLLNVSTFLLSCGFMILLFDYIHSGQQQLCVASVFLLHHITISGRLGPTKGVIPEKWLGGSSLTYVNLEASLWQLLYHSYVIAVSWKTDGWLAIRSLTKLTLWIHLNRGFANHNVITVGIKIFLAHGHGSFSVFLNYSLVIRQQLVNIRIFIYQLCSMTNQLESAMLFIQPVVLSLFC